MVGAVILLGLYHVASKPTAGIPFTEISSVDGVTCATADEAEMLLDRLAIGDLVSISVDGSETTRQIELQPYYSVIDLVITALVALTYYILAIYVLTQRPTDSGAKAFYTLACTVGVLISTTPGSVAAIDPLLGLALRAVFTSMYVAMPLALLHFALVYPTPPTPIMQRVVRVVDVIAGVAIAAITYHHLRLAFAGGDAELQGLLPISHVIHDVVRLWLLSLIAVSVAVFVRAYRRATSLETRMRLVWIFSGIVISGLGFVTVWVLPTLLHATPLLPEGAVVLLAIVAPVMFAVSIVRYQVLDITVIANLSVVHAVVIGIALSVYVGILTFAIHAYDLSRYLVWIILGIVLIDLLVFSRALGILQRVIGKTLFRVQYDFRELVQRSSDRITAARSVPELADVLTTLISETILPEFVLVTLFDQTTATSVQRSAGVRGVDVLTKPILSDDGTPLGAIVVGARRSGLAYTDMDQDVLATLARQTGVQLAVLSMEHAATSALAEHTRLEELSAAKSLFISSVTHDLKTPLTAISMYAELLRSSGVDDPQARHIDVIEGESARLTRLIDQVLTFSRIERGQMLYRPSPLDVDDVVQDVLALLQYHMVQQEVRLEVELHADGARVFMDRDALVNVCINLLTNAFKYGGQRRCVRVETSADQHAVRIAVSDQGIGISADLIGKITSAYYRVESEQTQDIAGMGLGLAIVRHALLAVGGSLSVESAVGEGSTFTVTLPRSTDGSQHRAR